MAGAVVGAVGYLLILSVAFNVYDFIKSKGGLHTDSLSHRDELYYKVKHASQKFIPDLIIVTDSTEEAMGVAPKHSIQDKIDEFGDTLQDLHIGQEIDNYLKSKDITQAKLAESMGVLPSQVTRIIKKHSIDSGKLTSISNTLDHNFFLDFYGNYEETSANLAIQVGLYMGKYNKLLLEYEDVNRQLLDCRAEAEKLKKEISELKSEINDLREENSKLKSGS